MSEGGKEGGRAGQGRGGVHGAGGRRWRQAKCGAQVGASPRRQAHGEVV